MTRKDLDGIHVAAMTS